VFGGPGPAAQPDHLDSARTRKTLHYFDQQPQRWAVPDLNMKIRNHRSSPSSGEQAQRAGLRKRRVDRLGKIRKAPHNHCNAFWRRHEAAFLHGVHPHVDQIFTFESRQRNHNGVMPAIFPETANYYGLEKCGPASQFAPWCVAVSRALPYFRHLVIS
jgi:hypothetical protein